MVQGGVWPVGQPLLLALGAKRVLKSTPDEAVASLETTVLLMKFTTSESVNDTPAPSQPATLLEMILLVTLTEYQFAGVWGKVDTSVPLTPWKRMPPPLPLSAALPIIRLASTTRPGPVPSPIPGGQSLSGTVVHTGSVSGAIMTMIAPPLVGVVGLVLWLNRIALCWMLPL